MKRLIVRFDYVTYPSGRWAVGAVRRPHGVSIPVEDASVAPTTRLFVKRLATGFAAWSAGDIGRYMKSNFNEAFIKVRIQRRADCSSRSVYLHINEEKIPAQE